MKYRVVKDGSGKWGCRVCCFNGDEQGCAVIGNKYGLISCITNKCHFEEIEDTKEEDNG